MSKEMRDRVRVAWHYPFSIHVTVPVGMLVFVALHLLHSPRSMQGVAMVGVFWLVLIAGHYAKRAVLLRDFWAIMDRAEAVYGGMEEWSKKTGLDPDRLLRIQLEYFNAAHGQHVVSLVPTKEEP